MYYEIISPQVFLTFFGKLNITCEDCELIYIL